MEAVVALAEAWQAARFPVVLTGAGASTESGLPDFRSKQGLWQGVDPIKLASLTALRRNPVEFYQFYRQRLSRLQGAKPNGVHRSLTALQRAGLLGALITQNVDGLHQAAGSAGVIEVHGSLRECVCMRCSRRFGSELIDVAVDLPEDVPGCPQCGGLLKPGVVLFEEPLPEAEIDRAVEAAHQADLFVVVGSSLEVGPVNQLPAMAAANGADVAMINLEPTHFDSKARWLIRERASAVLETLCKHLEL